MLLVHTDHTVHLLLYCVQCNVFQATLELIIPPPTMRFHKSKISRQSTLRISKQDVLYGSH